MSKVEERLSQAGLKVPAAPAPVGLYVPAVKINDLVFTSGQIPRLDGELKFKGKVGGAVSQEDGYKAAQICMLNALSCVKSVIGDLDNVVRVVRVTGYVASAPGFSQQPAVVNGASEVLRTAFGEDGAHARSAVGVAELPMDAPVEVELVVQAKA